MTQPAPPPAPTGRADATSRLRGWRRAALWAALVGLLVIAQSLLVALTVNYESSHAQELSETAAADAVSTVRSTLLRAVQRVQALMWAEPSPAQWKLDAADVMRVHREVVRIERRVADFHLGDAVASPLGPPLFSRIPRDQLSLEAEASCANARRIAAPVFSRSYFVPMPDGLGQEVMDVCVPVTRGGQPDGYVVATLSLQALLEIAIEGDPTRRHELSFIEGDGTRLARAGARRGVGVFQANRVVDLPGVALQLRADSAEGSPSLIPNIAVALVVGLSMGLFAVVVLLLRDVRKRGEAERALADALAFRKAMEDSLSTGLRARDLNGRITYVNPAFCAMVDFTADELMASAVPLYWPPEHAAEYAERQHGRLSRRPTEVGSDPRTGFETVFMRRNGERFPVMIYEAPLVDSQGRHTGWMSAALDISAQRRVEDLSRQQQERLQATARLATVGEMASLLSHELNQPLAAIASYATGSLNLLDDASDTPDPETPALMRQALTRIAEQAERAGRVIKSVHDFVRRREQSRESLRADQLIDAVMPLVRLQARKSGTRIEVELPSPVPRVTCDRTMVEQVLLNLTRNGIQAMEGATPLPQRVLTLRVAPVHERRVQFSVIDRGPGIAPDVAARLFTPFFTTRQEGMGLGLSLCRTVIEQHGGALDFTRATPGDGGSGVDDAPPGTEFRFTLPAERSAARDRALAGNRYDLGKNFRCR